MLILKSSSTPFVNETDNLYILLVPYLYCTWI